MRLDRNIYPDHGGKYALLKLRRLREIRSWDGGEGEIADQQAVEDALALLERAGILDWGDKPETEFFVMRLKDENAGDGLAGYAAAAMQRDPEYASEVAALAGRAGHNNPHCKIPD